MFYVVAIEHGHVDITVLGCFFEFSIRHMSRLAMKELIGICICTIVDLKGTFGRSHKGWTIQRMCQ
jgi:hypothetical protein